MSMYRWRFQRFAGWVIPLVILMLIFTRLVSIQVAPDGSRFFIDDQAYQHLVISENLNQTLQYGALPDEPLPMVDSMIWQGLMAVAQFFPFSADSAAVGLGVIFAMVTLLVLIRLSHSIFAFPLYAHVSAALLVLSPTLIMEALRGTGAPLGMALTAGALTLHIESMRKSGHGLPLSAAALLGLALWMRIEFVVIWLLLWLHAAIAAFIPAEKRPGRVATFFRGLNGMLIFALFLLPIATWNMLHMGVPWPRLPNVPLAADIWAHMGAGAAWQTTQAQIMQGLAVSSELFRQTAWPGGFFFGLFFLLGYVLMAVQVIRSSDDRVLLLFLLIPWVTPFFMALLYPYLGSASFSTVSVSFAPILLLMVSYGVVRLPFIVRSIVRERIPQLTSDQTFRIWWGAAGAIMLLVALLGMARERRALAADIARHDEMRQVITRTIEEHGLIRDHFLTDRPGWLTWAHGLRVVDIRSNWTPPLLRAVALEGGYDPERLTAYMGTLAPPPSVVIVWDEAFYQHANVLRDPRNLFRPNPDAPEIPLLVMERTPVAL